MGVIPFGVSLPRVSGRSSRERLLVIGLDGVPPDFLFRRFREQMPTVSRLVERGVRAPLRTTDPPISVPAWPVMFTGVDPGTLGFYGFRHRTRQSYTETYVPRSAQTPVPTVWQLASDAGRRVCMIGMPLAYPPPRLNGICISDFLTPPGSRDTTYPPELAAELERTYGPYPFDVEFRSDDRKELFQRIVKMTETRFRIATDLMAREPWDLFGVHEVGTDRLNHAYWKYFDPGHADFVPGNPYEQVARDYYRVVDAGIARLLEAAGPEVSVLIASDHGSMAMSGCFCLNQWLAENGYLAIGKVAGPGTPLEKVPVTWARTTVWGSGGYYGRIFFNIRGREPQGIVAADQVPVLRERLERDLAKVRQPDGTPLAVRVLDPKRIYHEVRGDAPDLILYFDELRWRSAGSLGHPSLFLHENDIGPDDAVHSFDGVFLWAAPDANPPGSDLPEQKIAQVAPTILGQLGIPVPSHVQASPIPLRGGKPP
jgi:predicted AlkP superfamily phosphohydrolase/phosphomutase